MDIVNVQYPAPLPGCVCKLGGAKVVAQNAFSLGCLGAGPLNRSKMKTFGQVEPRNGRPGAANNTLAGPDGFRDIANFQYPAPLPGCVCPPGGAKFVAQNAFSVGCLALGPQSGSKMKAFRQVESRNGGSWCGQKHLSRPHGFWDIVTFQYPARVPGCVCSGKESKVVAQNALALGCLGTGPPSGSKMKTFGQVEPRNGRPWCGQRIISGSRRVHGQCKCPVPCATAWLCV